MSVVYVFRLHKNIINTRQNTGKTETLNFMKSCIKFDIKTSAGACIYKLRGSSVFIIKFQNERCLL